MPSLERKRLSGDVTEEQKIVRDIDNIDRRSWLGESRLGESKTGIMFVTVASFHTESVGYIMERIVEACAIRMFK